MKLGQIYLWIQRLESNRLTGGSRFVKEIEPRTGIRPEYKRLYKSVPVFLSCLTRHFSEIARGNRGNVGLIDPRLNMARNFGYYVAGLADDRTGIPARAAH